MKSQHLAGFDLEVEDAECVVLRQVFHTQRLENLDFIGVLLFLYLAILAQYFKKYQIYVYLYLLLNTFVAKMLT